MMNYPVMSCPDPPPRSMADKNISVYDYLQFVEETRRRRVCNADQVSKRVLASRIKKLQEFCVRSGSYPLGVPLKVLHIRRMASVIAGQFNANQTSKHVGAGLEDVFVELRRDQLRLVEVVASEEPKRLENRLIRKNHILNGSTLCTIQNFVGKVHVLYAIARKPNIIR